VLPLFDNMTFDTNDEEFIEFVVVAWNCSVTLSPICLNLGVVDVHPNT
jgi:hypothetical protein